MRNDRKWWIADDGFLTIDAQPLCLMPVSTVSAAYQGDERMTDKPTYDGVPSPDEAPAKKPYVKPQLHVLSGHDAEGKQTNPSELNIGNGYGPS